MCLTYKKWAIIASMLFLFTGCVQMPLMKKETAQVPQWYLNAPANTSAYLYGTGEGTSLQSAKSAALNDMSGRLSVQVSSSLNQTTTTSRNNSGENGYNKEVTQNINIAVQNINFTNAVIEKTITLGNSFFVLMKVNRQELFNQTKQEFDMTNRRINDLLEVSNVQPILEQIYTLQNLQPVLLEAKNQASVLKALNNGFDESSYFHHYSRIENSLVTSKAAVKIKIATNLQSSYFADEFIDELNKNEYKIVSSNENVKITLNNKVNYSTAMGWKIAKVATTISVISNGKIISNNIINSVGRSTSSEINAVMSASKDFKLQLLKKGLDSILFNK
ncbi:MAG: LPP20 family lipoprotein [Candidatus Marinarcus sp.]|uniref:LPP20 family lipoprotein n=1 Tax=Candidatus Marinarcus sp. TaxID=3100987 RepID=UPI003B00988B